MEYDPLSINLITCFEGYILKDKHFTFIVTVVYWLIVAALFFFGLKYLFPLLAPFIFAFAVAALLQRPIHLLQGRFKKLPRTFVAIIVISGFIVVACALVATVGVALFNQIYTFAAELPQMFDDLFSNISGNDVNFSWLPDRLSAPLSSFYNTLLEDLPGTILDFSQNLIGPLVNSLGAIGSFAMKLPSLLLSLLIFIISTFFIGTDFEGTKALITDLIPQSLASRFVRLKNCSFTAVISLLKTYSLLMLITFVELVLGLSLINLLGMTINHIIPIALLISFIDILPVLGVGAVLIPWALISMLNGHSALGIALLILYAIITVVRNILEPRLVGQRFGLHPIATLFAIYIGGKLFGVIGVFLLPLTIIIIKQLWHPKTALQ